MLSAAVHSIRKAYREFYHARGLPICNQFEARKELISIMAHHLRLAGTISFVFQCWRYRRTWHVTALRLGTVCSSLAWLQKHYVANSDTSFSVFEMGLFIVQLFHTALLFGSYLVFDCWSGVCLGMIILREGGFGFQIFPPSRATVHLRTNSLDKIVWPANAFESELHRCSSCRGQNCMRFCSLNLALGGVYTYHFYVKLDNLLSKRKAFIEVAAVAWCRDLVV